MALIGAHYDGELWLSIHLEHAGGADGGYRLCCVLAEVPTRQCPAPADGRVFDSEAEARAAAQWIAEGAHVALCEEPSIARKDRAEVLGRVLERPAAELVRRPVSDSGRRRRLSRAEVRLAVAQGGLLPV